MKRNVVGIIIGAISLVLFFVALSFSTPQTKYANARTSYDAIQAIIDSRQEAKNSLTTGIKFNGRKLYYADQNDTWYYSILEGDPNAYNPSIQLDTGGLHIAFANNNELSEELIKSSGKIDFVIYDNQYYSQYKLVATTLPIIEIDHQAEQVSEYDTSMSFELFDNRKEALKNVVQSKGKIRLHGSTATLFEKKSYRLELSYESVGNHNRPYEEPLLGMDNDEDWLLIANYNDDDRIRNQLNSALWSEASSDSKNLPSLRIETRNVEVIENGQYGGLYLLSSIINSDRLGLKRGATGIYDEYLYKKGSWGDSEENIAKTATNTAFKSIGFELKSLEHTNENEAWSKLNDYLYNCYTDKKVDYIKRYSDNQNLIDVNLFTIMTQNTDVIHSDTGSVLKNVYIANIHTENGEKFIYIPWDFDLTWGNTFDMNYDLYVYRYGYAPNYVQNTHSFVTGTLLDDSDEFKEQTVNRYRELRNTHWSNDRISELIEQSKKEVFDSGAYYRERERWPNSIYNNGSFDTLSTYINKRLEYLDYLFGLRSDIPDPLAESKNYKNPISDTINPITFEAIPAELFKTE